MLTNKDVELHNTFQMVGILGWNGDQVGYY